MLYRARIFIVIRILLIAFEIPSSINERHIRLHSPDGSAAPVNAVSNQDHSRKLRRIMPTKSRIQERDMAAKTNWRLYCDLEKHHS